MRYITLDTGTPGEPALLQLDLGNVGDDQRTYDRGDLAVSHGNLYIHVDGQAWGSLHFHHDPDTGPRVTLGQHDAWIDEWAPRNPLTDPETEDRDPTLLQLIAAAAAPWHGEDHIIDEHLNVQAELIADVMPELPPHQDFQWIKLQIQKQVKR